VKLWSICSEQGCPTECAPGKLRCDEHTSLGTFDKPFLSSPQWRTMRAIIIERDAGVCQEIVDGERCGKPANQVDHIVPRREGGALLDPDNLVLLCPSCHSKRTARMPRTTPRVAVPREPEHVRANNERKRLAFRLFTGGADEEAVMTATAASEATVRRWRREHSRRAGR